jgi:hypothetical protein
VIAYGARLDVPRELVRHLARLLAADRRAHGTRMKKEYVPELRIKKVQFIFQGWGNPDTLIIWELKSV